MKDGLENELLSQNSIMDSFLDFSILRKKRGDFDEQSNISLLIDYASNAFSLKKKKSNKEESIEDNLE